MSEYLTKEEIKQWRSSLEKITLEEFARRLGKEVEGAKKTHDIVDMYVNQEPISTTFMPEIIKKPETKRVSRLVDEVTKSDDEVIKRSSLQKEPQRSVSSDKKEKESRGEHKIVEEKPIVEKEMPVSQESAESATVSIIETVDTPPQPKKEEKPAKTEEPKVVAKKTQNENALVYKDFSLAKKLTEREILVLDSLIESAGASVKAQELAEKLDIPRDYIYKYIKNLRKKLQNASIINSEEGGFIIER